MNIGYVASTIIAGIIMISVVALNMRISQNSGEQTLYSMANTNANMLAEFFRHDLRSMGYGIEGGSPVLEAGSNHIRFQVHFEGQAEPTEITWSFEPDSSTSYRNPAIRPLYRIVNGEVDQVGVGITGFGLEYLDSNRNILDPATAPLTEIRQIRLNLVVESTEGYGDGRYGRSTWTGEITPYNLN